MGNYEYDAFYSYKRDPVHDKGTDYFKEEPGLNDEDKWALIEFLKTM
jgi:hypothetical protein